MTEENIIDVTENEIERQNQDIDNIDICNKRLRLGDVILLLLGHTLITVGVLFFMTALIVPQPKKNLTITHAAKHSPNQTAIQITIQNSAQNNINLTTDKKKISINAVPVSPTVSPISVVPVIPVVPAIPVVPVESFSGGDIVVEMTPNNNDDQNNIHTKLTQQPREIVITQSEPIAPPQHPLAQLLSKDKRTSIILIVFICAVISAPLLEEFLYRGVLTGWLIESTKIYLPLLGINNKTVKILRPTIAICLPALFFASLHVSDNQDRAAEVLIASIAAVTLANLFTLTLGIFYLVEIRKFSCDQIGFQMKYFGSDILLSILVAICVIPPLLCLTGALRLMFPALAIDPFPLFFFAVALGVVFMRTRRLLPCILIHAMLNGVSFILLVL
jgi:membrane protease YdiL (CAAX protease family)